MDAVTEWFSPAIKPVHKGAYETHIPEIDRHDNTFQYWNGGQWGRYSYNAIDAALRGNADFASGHQSPQWRGLASDPKASKP